VLIRILLVGAILAGFTGAAVFYGFGELDGNVNEAVDSSAVVESQKDNNKTDNKVSDITESENQNVADVPINEAVSDIVKPKKTLPKTSDLKVRKADKAVIDKVADDKVADEKGEGEKSAVKRPASKKPASDTLKDMLNKPIDKQSENENDAKQIVAKPSEPVKPSELVKSAAKKAKDVMTPSATGAFIVTDKAATTTNTDAKAESAVKTQDASPEIPLSDLSDEDVRLISEILTEALNTADKTQRDKIYLDVFDNAIDSGSIELAARVSDKLSTPKLRELTRGIIDNTGK